MSVRILSFLEDSVADRDPGPGAVLILGSGIRIRDPGWEKIRIQDEPFLG